MKRKKETWTPLQLAELKPTSPNADLVDKALATEDFKIYLNNLYQVAVYEHEETEHFPAYWHLSIKRVDRSAKHDWRHLQRIKNELCGIENEGVELYPAESRLVDTANQFHLWVFCNPTMRFQFGFTERAVSEGDVMGVIQRRFPRTAVPVDCEELTEESYSSHLQEYLDAQPSTVDKAT